MSYFAWPKNQTTIRLALDLANADGTGATGKSPQVAIQRVSDGFYWTGAAFASGITQLAMTEVSASDQPGHYEYAFTQPQAVATYRVYLRHTSAPVGFDTELHDVLETVSAAVGAREVTLSLEDQDTDPVPFGVFDVFDASNTTFLVRVRDEDGDGDAVVYLNDGTYAIRATAPRFTQNTPPAALVVNGVEALTVSGVVTPAASSGDPALCTVSGTARSADGEPIEGLVVGFYADGPQGLGDDVLTQHRVEVTTDADGYFEVDLVREARVRVRCALGKLDGLVIVVPDAGSASLAELVEDAL